MVYKREREREREREKERERERVKKRSIRYIFSYNFLSFLVFIILTEDFVSQEK